MSNFSTFFPGSGGGGGGGAIGDYGLKPMAEGVNVFTDPNDASVWFKTGHTSTDTVTYPDFTPIFGTAATYPQATNTNAFASQAVGNAGHVEYNNLENKIFIKQIPSYVIGNFNYRYELDPANISSGNWGNTPSSGAASSIYSFEPVGDGVGNSYVLKASGASNSGTAGSFSQTRTGGWMYQQNLKIGKVSGGTRATGYTFNQTINLTGIPTGSSSATSTKYYQIPLGLVATENYFYYSFLQQNPNSTTYLTYYYGDGIFYNVDNSLTNQAGQMAQPSDPTKVFARVRCVKLSKTGAFVSEFTRPFSDTSGGGGALLVFTDPASTGNSFWTLDKNSIQNGTGPALPTQYAGWQVNTTHLDFGKTYTIRKHSEDGTVIKTSGPLPITSVTQTARATSFYQSAFCTADGSPHYFTAASFSGSAAQTIQKAPTSPLSNTFNIIKLGNVIGDSSPRFTSLPTSGGASQTGMGINTSNVQIKSGPSQAAFTPSQLYIRVA